ncbi:MAG: hypothetical protein NTV00_12450 [Methylococcales bacterium]|nr:hypothetical protein [Methylococcales bacterium]
MPAVQYSAQQTDHDSLRQLIYTPIEEAIRLLDARQKLPQLELLDFDVPEALTHPRTVIMFRQIATPNHEMRRAVGLCEKYQLNLLILSFQDDKFSSHNSCKHALGRMGFFNGLGRHGGKKIRYSTIINFNQYNGRPFRECETFRGQSLMKFHHDLLLQEFPQLNTNNIVECSEWFIRHREKTGNLYRSYLKLFLKHAILFETFLLSDSELDFTLTRALPAFREITEEFGIKPLIVHSETLELEGDDFWQLYPDHLHQFAPHDRRKTAR